MVYTNSAAYLYSDNVNQRQFENEQHHPSLIGTTVTICMLGIIRC